MRRVVVTGGGGCLGANVIEHLLATGDAVLSVDNQATSAAVSLAPHPNLESVSGTIADRAMVDDLFDRFQPSHVVHSAAAYKDPDDWAEDVSTNVAGTINVTCAAMRLKVRRFINFQTSLCYGRAVERPVTLAHPLAPLSSYAISKNAAERYLGLSGLSYASFRMAIIYGPRHYSGPIPTFYKRLKAGLPCTIADTRRDFVAMEDFLGLMDLALDDQAPGGVFNVGSGLDYAIKTVFDRLVDILGVRLAEPPAVMPPNADDVSNLLLDPSATEAAFGWKATVGLDDGLRRQVAWYDAHGTGQGFTHLRGGKG